MSEPNQPDDSTHDRATELAVHIQKTGGTNEEWAELLALVAPVVERALSTFPPRICELTQAELNWQICRKLTRYNAERSPFSVWWYRVARNLALDQVARRRVQSTEGFDFEEDDPAGSDHRDPDLATMRGLLDRIRWLPKNRANGVDSFAILMMLMRTQLILEHEINWDDAESLFPWQPEEMDRRFTTTAPTLSDVWNSLRNFQGAGSLPGDNQALTELMDRATPDLPINKAVWYTWKSRNVKPDLCRELAKAMERDAGLEKEFGPEIRFIRKHFCDDD